MTATPKTTRTPTPIATPFSLLNHFQCYQARGRSRVIRGISLDDRFGASTVDAIRTRSLCLPADKNDEDPTAPSDPDHLTGYRIRQTTPAFVPLSNQVVANQFGTTIVNLVSPDYFLVPTAKSLSAPPPPLAQSAVDHFKCYRVEGARTDVPGVKVDDQFGTLIVDVQSPSRLCVPANKNGEGVLDPGSNLLCYQVRRAAGSPPFTGAISAFINNQFGADTLRIVTPTDLCVPSVVNP